MSYVTNLPYVEEYQEGYMPGAEVCACSYTGYWVAIIFLLALVILFVILFIVALNSTSGDICDPLDIPDAQITANATAITATWSDLKDPDDTVTLYASTKQIKLNPLGEAIGDNVIRTSTTGKDKTIALTVGTQYKGGVVMANTTYYVALVVTKLEVCQYHTVHDIVFTQSQSVLTTETYKPFSINDLVQKGGIGPNGNYVDASSSNFELGNWEFSNGFIRSFPIDSESKYLCNVSGSLTAVDSLDNVVSTQNCQWIYNPDGLNRWCNTSIPTGSTVVTPNGSGTDPNSRLCMIRNSNTSNLINVSSGTASNPFKWANTPVFFFELS